MKMKILPILGIVLSTAVIITACKKESSSTTTSTDSSVELSAQADDQSRVSTEIDAVANDANTALSTVSNVNGGRLETVICDATITADTTSDPKTVTITYNGTNCLGNRSRTGTVILSLPANEHWKDAGAVLTVTAHNLKITRLSDNKSITINGTKTITNVSGGLLTQLASQGTITHTINSSGITITFDDNTQRSWQIAEQRVFTYNNGIVISVTGTHTDGNNTGILEWGTNRSGHAFASSILQPLVVRQDCDFRLVSGQMQHTVPTATASVTFGLDKTGNPVSCPSGNYYMKLTWEFSSKTYTLILPY